MRPDPHVRNWIKRQLASSPPRTPSLIITVWGDSLAPHGGAVLLPGLIALLASFGLNERLVRTNVFRLARENWLRSSRVGRRSLYRLTPEGERRFEEAYRRIYAASEEQWNDDWEMVVADGLAASKRRALTRELHWAGFGNFAPCVFARPAHGPSPLPKILAALMLTERVVVARVTDDVNLGGQPLNHLVAAAWNLESVAAAYRRFLQRFGTVIERFRQRNREHFDPEQCFVVRTLLIHAYRRVLLRDPQLPPALLPLDWPGAGALALCGDFYRLTHEAAERHLIAVLQNEQGPLPPAAPWFFERFGGLGRS
jgi:phenylacetic acid degradation operon negative regulatory protein